MPHAVTHIIITMVIVSLIRHYIVGKQNMKLYLVLVGGLGGILPDLDIPIYWVLRFLNGANLLDVHRGTTHTIYFLLIFIIIALVFQFLVKHKELTKVFWILSLGIFLHLILDAVLSGYINPLYFDFLGIRFGIDYPIGLNILDFQGGLEDTLVPAFDGVVLILWLIHEYAKNNIKEFF